MEIPTMVDSLVKSAHQKSNTQTAIIVNNNLTTNLIVCESRMDKKKGKH